MGIFAQIIGTLGMFAGVVVAAFGFTLVGTGGFLLLPYGIGLFVANAMQSSVRRKQRSGMFLRAVFESGSST
ncbi:hypothetical protein ABE527_15010 [Brucella sp. TWI432]